MDRQINSEKNIISIFDLVGDLIPHLFVYGTSVVFKREPDKNSFKVKIKDLMLKNEEADGIIIESLEASFVNIKDGNIKKSLKESSIIIEKFNLLIPEIWINNALEFLEKRDFFQEINNLKVDFNNQVMSIKGAYRAGFNFAFAVDLKFEIKENKIVIDFNRFLLGDTISMPKMFQKALLNFLHGYLKKQKRLIKGIDFQDRDIFIDYLAFIPNDTYFHISNIYINKGFLVVQGGANLEESLKLIKEKEDILKNKNASKKDNCAKATVELCDLDISEDQKEDYNEMLKYINSANNNETK